MSETVPVPRIRFDRDRLQIEFQPLFGRGAEGHTRRFACRAFAFSEVRSLQLEPGSGKAAVHFQVAPDKRTTFVGALATAIGGTEAGLDEALLPQWGQGEPVILHRFAAGVSVFQITQAGSGRLLLRHAALAQDPILTRRIENAVRAVNGVKQATATGITGKLWVSYQPDAVDMLQVVRAAEAELTAPRTALATLNTPTAKMGLANATLGLAAVGEFALPVMLPVCVGILVVSNLGTLRDAGRQMGEGKVGLPVLYTALLGCSITTGQIVAHALMEWSFRFWAQRSDAVLVEECRAVLAENLPIPAHSRLVRSDEVDAEVPTTGLHVGERVRIGAAGTVPVDGRVVAGSALVEERAVCGSRTPMRKSFGDKVFAGSQVLAGDIEVEAWQTGLETRAAHIAQRVIDCTRDLDRHPLLRRKAEALADRAVLPTLAAAGLGWAAGAAGLFTVGAVLHADYASGPKLAVPVETLRGMGLALRNGAVTQTADALHRLAESRFIVLDDHPAWTARGLELDRLEHRLTESETDNLLRHVAGAGLYLGDGRSAALVDAALRRGLIIRQPPLISLNVDKVTVRQGQHTMSLRHVFATDEGDASPLAVEIDGTEVATLMFRLSPHPYAATAVARLRQLGMQVFLLSERQTEETERLARQLGIELCSGEFSPAEKLRFLQSLRRRGVRATYVGNGQANPALGEASHVSVTLGGAAGLADGTADIVVLGDALDAFADVADLALEQDGRIRHACRKSLLPNLLCVVGGYAGVLNGITAGLIANVGVGNVYRKAAQSLRDSRRKPNLKRISV